MNPPISAAAAQREAVRKFTATNLQTCSCSRLEIRQEGGLLLCAACDAPIVTRKASGVRDLRKARFERILSDLRALQRMTEDFEAERLAAGAIAEVIRLQRKLSTLSGGAA